MNNGFEWSKIFLSYWGADGAGNLEEFTDVDKVLARVKALIESGKVCDISVSNYLDPKLSFEGYLEV